MSQQLPPGIHRQGFDAAVQANAARPDASGVELRTYAGLTPEFLTPEFRPPSFPDPRVSPSFLAHSSSLFPFRRSDLRVSWPILHPCFLSRRSCVSWAAQLL
jgi:hypothetical protein